MNDKETRDQYALELTRRFDELREWALTNWPVKSYPLLPSDFSASGREIGEILGPKLAHGDNSGGDDNKSHCCDDQPQYISVTPMPWP